MMNCGLSRIERREADSEEEWVSESGSDLEKEAPSSSSSLGVGDGEENQRGGGGGGGGKEMEKESLCFIASRASSLLDLLEKEEHHPSPLLRLHLKKTSSALKSKIREELAGGRSMWRRVVTGNQEKSVREHLRERRREPKVVKQLDKMSFTGGVLCLLLTEFIVAVHPGLFWAWFCLVIPSLLAIRYVMYRAERWLYFLIDFCYFANLMCFAGLFLFPRSITLFQLNFVFASGPLAWAIIAWRNSLVFHSIDKITSIFIHSFPTLLMFCLRWYPSPYLATPPTLGETPFQVVRVMGLSLFFYVFWQAAYFLKTELLDRELLDSDPNLQTSLRWLARDSRNALHILVLRIVRALGLFRHDEPFDPSSTKTKLVFMTSQLLFTLGTFLPVPLFYHSFPLHLSFLLFVFLVSIYNGAGYYIEVFSQQYSSKFHPVKAPKGVE